MKNILTAPFIRELGETAANMYRQGWDERNSGNISLLLDEEEIKEYLDTEKVIKTFPLGIDASPLAGRYFAATGTGKYFKNIEKDPEKNLGIARVSPDGRSVMLLWGLSDGGGFTSELSAHLLGHLTRLKTDPENRIVMHCHPQNLLAMTHIHALDEREFNRSLWQMCTESIIIFPDGVGVLPWMVCGTDEIAEATAEKLREYRIIIWALHGLYAVGRTLDEALGLTETAEKAAMIYMLTAGHERVNRLSDDDLRAVAKQYGQTPKEAFLN
ncbi:MAG: rhamnulose-1-phosphate aldolase [Oscillospiraceae bacterium]|nr:rhamnulose-1-phosphate aldolase [Oscillospiraceae bacterium]